MDREREGRREPEVSARGPVLSGSHLEIGFNLPVARGGLGEERTLSLELRLKVPEVSESHCVPPELMLL